MERVEGLERDAGGRGEWCRACVGETAGGLGTCKGRTEDQ